MKPAVVAQFAYFKLKTEETPPTTPTSTSFRKLVGLTPIVLWRKRAETVGYKGAFCIIYCG